MEDQKTAPPKPTKSKDQPKPQPKTEPELPPLQVDQLTHLIKGLGTDIKDLHIDAKGSRVIVSGEVDEQAEREKIILTLGNVQGVSSVRDQIRVVKPKPQAIFYEVKKGDSLSKIAKRYYGDPMKFRTIFEANRPMLKDPDKIYPGQVLRIPVEG